jgi:predicted ABC-type ATPase
MQPPVKRLRIFAGPNGSGKSSLFDYLLRIKAFHLYYHINADEIARDITVACDYNNWPIEFSQEELGSFLDRSTFQKLVPYCFSSSIQCKAQSVSLYNSHSTDLSYLCAAIADFLRKKMTASGSSFSYETVFSHPSKIDEIKRAQDAGFKTYLYIISTETPEINVERIENRVKQGGHAVPKEKTTERYQRTMANLGKAYRMVDRVYFYDNSSADDLSTYQYFAEKRDGKLFIRNGSVPLWFERYMLDKG